MAKRADFVPHDVADAERLHRHLRGRIEELEGLSLAHAKRALVAEEKVDEVIRWLEARAESFGRDAVALREDGDTPMAVAYEEIRDELRACASEVR